MLILTFIMNLFDFYIVDKYYYCFSKERKRNTFFSITTLVASAFVLSIVNAIGYPIANLICSMFLIYLYCTNFMLPRTYYLFLPMLYLGLGFMVLLRSQLAYYCWIPFRRFFRTYRSQ